MLLDNYFNGLKLVLFLMSIAVHVVGIIRSNRVKAPGFNLFYTKTGIGKGNRGDMKCHKIRNGIFKRRRGG